MEISHKGWDWTRVQSDTWLQVSEEFLPIALQWKEKFQSILDIGTGKGRHAFFFSKNGLDVSAVDLSASSIEIINKLSKEQGLSIHTCVSDMTKLPFQNESFDCVVCFHTIYHTDYVGLKKAIAEIQRVLHKEGEAFISFNSKDNPSYRKEESIDGYTMIKSGGIEEGIPHCYVDEGDLKELLSDFKVISLRKIQEYVRQAKAVSGIHYYAHIKKNDFYT